MKKIYAFVFAGLCMLQTAQAQFVSSGNSAAAPIWYNGAGNVGIGTTTPAYKFDVSASSNTTSYLMRVNNTFPTGRGLWVSQVQPSTGGNAQQEVARFSKVVGTTETVLMTIRTDNKVGIGTALSSSSLPSDANQFRLFVKDGIRTEKVKVDLASTGWGDYVFEPSYRLRPLAELEAFIQVHKHLPEVPSEKELQENGLNLGEMHKMQMVKIEELTLYLIEQQKQIEALKAEIEVLKKQK